ncbi:Helix-turn-helix domain protein [Stieleria maiorica]|uniref:Helix-turn-helix domain protein n=1 Tax=Stieleria maiorica TaxID=2795974 RepID=A0A5B9MPF1_9BACT|nr:helix-turn-helix domain-containing protein [Stieleria maiorica]QEG01546.1 Helix-turn-helix domain protein [Stieleria maiorica]
MMLSKQVFQQEEEISMADGEVAMRLERIERLLESLIEQKRTKEYYSTAEVAQILNRAEFTVREWCRHGRVWAEKRGTGRGLSKEWMISREELERIENEGLLPI